MSAYRKEVKIPIRIIKTKSPDLVLPLASGKKSPIFRALKGIFCYVLVFSMFVSQTLLFTAFEAHIINVTAHICRYSETRQMGYWRKHPEIYVNYLPQDIGEDSVGSQKQVSQIFSNYNLSARDNLKAQLLAMKFNISIFGIGEYVLPVKGVSLYQLASEADNLLINPSTSDLDLETTESLLRSLNSLYQIKFCPPGGTGGPVPKIVINEIYFFTDSRKSCGSTEKDLKNEWVEIYNPTDDPIDISGWRLSDDGASIVIPESSPIPSGSFAIISQTDSTWKFWNIPEDAIKIVLNDRIGDGLGNSGDRLALVDSEGNIADQMSYGEDNTILNLAPPLDLSGNTYQLPTGHSLARVPDGFDTDDGSDFKDSEDPTPGQANNSPYVKVFIPNGGEIWHIGQTHSIEWSAADPLGDSDDLLIDIFYSTDSGENWIYQIADKVPNSGGYDWTIPNNSILISSTARVKVVATSTDNRIGWDKSDCDFCPPAESDIIVSDIQTVNNIIDTSATIDQSVFREDSSLMPEPSPNPESTVPLEGILEIDDTTESALAESIQTIPEPTSELIPEPTLEIPIDNSELTSRPEPSFAEAAEGMPAPTPEPTPAQTPESVIESEPAPVPIQDSVALASEQTVVPVESTEPVIIPTPTQEEGGENGDLQGEVSAL